MNHQNLIEGLKDAAAFMTDVVTIQPRAIKHTYRLVRSGWNGEQEANIPLVAGLQAVGWELFKCMPGGFGLLSPHALVTVAFFAGSNFAMNATMVAHFAGPGMPRTAVRRLRLQTESNNVAPLFR